MGNRFALTDRKKNIRGARRQKGGAPGPQCSLPAPSFHSSAPVLKVPAEQSVLTAPPPKTPLTQPNTIFVFVFLQPFSFYATAYSSNSGLSMALWPQSCSSVSVSRTGMGLFCF